MILPPVMHYPFDAFTIRPGLTTIALRPGIALPPGVTNQTVGQREALSVGDVLTVREMSNEQARDTTRALRPGDRTHV